jgi:glutamyl-tRNA reductase
VIITLGVSHQTAPIEIREMVALGPEGVSLALKNLKQNSSVNEAVIISTCNRTEIYAFVPPDCQQYFDIKEWWYSFCGGQSAKKIDESAYLYTDYQAITHLFRVASGLDSMVIGEPQILGQLKKAYQFSQDNAMSHKVLSKLFESSFKVAKSVRTKTEIGANPLSIAYCAVVLAKKIFSNLQDTRVCLIGAGDTTELLMQHLLSNGVKNICVVNRSLENAMSLAQPWGIEAYPLSELSTHIANADIVMSATNSPNYIIDKSMVFSSLMKGKRRPVFMVDLAVPRDIDPEVDEHEDIYLYTVDDLKGIVDENYQLRQNAAKNAERLIKLEVSAFNAWMSAQGLIETVSDFRQYSSELKDEVLNEAKIRLDQGESIQDVLHFFAHSFTQKLLHRPTIHLRDASFRQDYDKIALVRKIFEFDKVSDENLHSK